MIKRLIYIVFFTGLWLGGMSFNTVIVSSLFTLFVTYVILPFVFHYSSSVQRHLVFLPFVKYPYFVDFNEPEKEGLTGTRNFYLQTEANIKVGVWHVLPNSLVESCPPKDSPEYTAFFEKSLSSNRPVYLYLHGNTSSRAVAHRVQLYNLLRNLDCHVVAFDYRGYADSSSATLEEVGVVNDAKVVYKYVKKLIGDSKLIVWGHSLGTGVTCHLTSIVSSEGESPNAVILESPFNNIKDEIKYHPLASIFVKMPNFEWLFLEPLKGSGIEFRSDEHIANIKAPVLIFHAKDDLVVPFVLGKKLYETALRVRGPDMPPVKFIDFDSSHGYGHKFIYLSPSLKGILKGKNPDEAMKMILAESQEFNVEKLMEYLKRINIYDKI